MKAACCVTPRLWLVNLKNPVSSVPKSPPKCFVMVRRERLMPQKELCDYLRSNEFSAPKAQPPRSEKTATTVVEHSSLRGRSGGGLPRYQSKLGTGGCGKGDCAENLTTEMQYSTVNVLWRLPLLLRPIQKLSFGFPRMRLVLLYIPKRSLPRKKKVLILVI